MTDFRMTGLGVYRRRSGSLADVNNHAPSYGYVWRDSENYSYTNTGRWHDGETGMDIIELIKLYDDQPASVLALNLTPPPIKEPEPPG